jgi:hypothetical protein
MLWVMLMYIAECVGLVQALYGHILPNIFIYVVACGSLTLWN